MKTEGRKPVGFTWCFSFEMCAERCVLGLGVMFVNGVSWGIGYLRLLH